MVDISRNTDRNNMTEKEINIMKIAEESGWSKRKAQKEVSNARERLGISSGNFLKHKFWRVPLKDQKEVYKKLINGGQIEVKDRSQNYVRALFSGIDKMNWSFKKAREDLKNAKKEYGINNKEYYENEFCTVPEKERKAVAEKILSDREFRRSLKELTPKERRIKKISRETGWSEEKVIENLDDARRRLGISPSKYYKYKFHLMPEQEQKEKYGKLINKGLIDINDRGHAFSAAVFSGIDKMNWSYNEAREDIRDAKQKYGITSKEYYLDDFCVVPENERAALAERILRERELTANEQRETVKAKTADREARIARVQKETGWSRETAIEKMERAKRNAGSTYENYSICRFWELSDEKQRTFFTVGVSKQVRIKYSYEHIYERRIAYYKDLFCKLFQPYLGRKWASTVNLKYEDFEEMFRDEPKVIYKPRTGVGGHGIQMIDINDPGELKSIYDRLMALPFGTIESYLVQHPKMQKYSGKSVNTIRLVTIRTNNPEDGIETGKVHFIYGGMRMGGKSGNVDNLHSGGMIAALDVEKGVLITPASDHTNTIYKKHPATGAKIKGFKIPFYKESIELIKKTSEEFDLEGYLGWDIAITENGPVIIEINNNPGSDGLQTPYAPYGIGMRHLFDEYIDNDSFFNGDDAGEEGDAVETDDDFDAEAEAADDIDIPENDDKNDDDTETDDETDDEDRTNDVDEVDEVDEAGEAESDEDSKE
ncbi:MAG: hypothetical protein IJF96_00270 [Firmicutes bacterium]|nr:hypothetical protein [Bacillota bacterium]